jgi:hypothetical protein
MIRISLLFFVALVLSACGGGSGSTPNQVVDTPPSPPPATPTVTLQINGALVAPLLSNATITATVGDKIFDTVADEQGNYTLDIEVDEDQQEHLLILDARGVGNFSHVHYKTYADSVANLLNIGGVLSDQAVASLRISRLQTAIAAVLAHENDVVDLDSMTTSMNTYDRLFIAPLATALTYYTTGVNGVILDLPDNASTTLELALNKTESNIAVSTLIAENNRTFFDVMAELFINPDFVGFSTQITSVTDTYYLIKSHVEQSSGRLDLSEGGNASIQLFSSEVSGTWDLQDRLLTLLPRSTMRRLMLK